jgi:hypothetical protein
MPSIPWAKIINAGAESVWHIVCNGAACASDLVYVWLQTGALNARRTERIPAPPSRGGRVSA